VTGKNLAVYWKMAVSVWTVPDFVIPFALPYFVAVIFPENPFHVAEKSAI